MSFCGRERPQSKTAPPGSENIMPNATDTAAVVDTMRSLALSAGREIMRIYESDFTVEFKDDRSPITDADRAADAVIVEGLTQQFPEIPIVTEERTESQIISQPDDPFFIVDPLDGTKEFASRNGEFTVNIALVIGRRPRLGVVFAPAVGRLFYTLSEDQAVEENTWEGNARRQLQISSADNAALRVVASKSHRDPATDAYIERYNVTEFKGAGSSLKFCLVAAGEADLYPRLGRTMEWDIAAGHAVLSAAGGSVDRLDGGKLEYGKPGFENPPFLAYAPGVETIAA